MRLLRIYIVGLIAYLMAASSPVFADDLDSVPSPSEFAKIKQDYERVLGVDMRHVSVVYDQPNISLQSPVYTARYEKKGTCVIGVNRNASAMSLVKDFLAGVPDKTVAKEFLVAHEMTHCLFSTRNTVGNVHLLGLDLADKTNAQETIADMVALLFLEQTGVEMKPLLVWLNKERSGNLLYPSYNTGRNIDEEKLAKLKALMLTEKPQEFGYFVPTIRQAALPQDLTAPPLAEPSVTTTAMAEKAKSSEPSSPRL